MAGKWSSSLILGEQGSHIGLARVSRVMFIVNFISSSIKISWSVLYFPNFLRENFLLSPGS